jgi:acid phosphatase type 7
MTSTGSRRRYSLLLVLLAAGFGLAFIAAGGVPAASPVSEQSKDPIVAGAGPVSEQSKTPVVAAASPVSEQSKDPIVAAAGDIGDCESMGDDATAALLTDPSWTIITLGDTVYESGTPEEFARCYDPVWGAYKARTHPAVGNHEYLTPGAAGYFGYFGREAGDPTKGYYSFNLGTWHVVVINSNCSMIGGCGQASPQVEWLKADLADHPAYCTLAVWHHPMFGSTGQFTDKKDLKLIWTVLYNAGAEVVLNGHAHNYERMAPQDPEGQIDPVRGLREFVVGTGGKSHQVFQAIAANSEVRDDDTFGVLKLTLHAESYDWKFLPVSGTTFTDSGAASCH